MSRSQELRRRRASAPASNQSFARKLTQEYFERFPKDRYQTEVESWRQLQSFNVEFTMKRLREPIEADSIAPVKGTVMSLHEGFE